MFTRVLVDDDGIWTEGAPSPVGYPWTEITDVSICVLVLPPDDRRFRYLDVSHESGEFLELGDDLAGFRAAVAAIAARSGRPGLDVDAEPPDGRVEIYPARTVGG